MKGLICASGWLGVIGALIGKGTQGEEYLVLEEAGMERQWLLFFLV